MSTLWDLTAKVKVLQYIKLQLYLKLCMLLTWSREWNKKKQTNRKQRSLLCLNTALLWCNARNKTIVSFTYFFCIKGLSKLFTILKLLLDFFFSKTCICIRYLFMFTKPKALCNLPNDAIYDFSLLYPWKVKADNAYEVLMFLCRYLSKDQEKNVLVFSSTKNNWKVA